MVRMRVPTMVLCAILACFGCGRCAGGDVERVPWQPHGFRAPTVACDFDLPSGLVRSASPMPDHVAEFMSSTLPPSTLILSERVEPDLATALLRIRAFHRSGLLTTAGARTTTDEALQGAQAPAHLIAVASTIDGVVWVETVAVLAFPGLPLIEAVARSRDGTADVVGFVRSLRCSRKQ